MDARRWQKGGRGARGERGKRKQRGGRCVVAWGMERTATRRGADLLIQLGVESGGDKGKEIGSRKGTSYMGTATHHHSAAERMEQ